MESISQELSFLTEMAKGITAQFGDNCEVVVHDWSKPVDSTIVIIENGHVTGRKVGDPVRIWASKSCGVRLRATTSITM